MANPRRDNPNLTQGPNKGAIEYENTELPAVFVEGAQGMLTPNGSALHMSLYSEYIKAQEKVVATLQERKEEGGLLSVSFKADDPYQLDRRKEIQVVRRIEGRFFLTSSFLKQFIPWLQQKLEELEKKDA